MATVDKLPMLAEGYEWLQREVWSSRESSPALAGGPQTRIAKVMETQQY